MSNDKRRRLENLEADMEAERARRVRGVMAEALSRLSTEDLRALDRTFEDDCEADPEGEEKNFVEVYGGASERGRRALDALFETIAAVQREEQAAEDPRDPTGTGDENARAGRREDDELGR